MKMKTLLSYLLLSLTIFGWSGCRGPMGPAGYDGMDGLDGNANVTTSKWFSSPGWTWDKNDNVWYFDVVNSAISKDIVINGVVLAYVKISGDVINDYTVRPLPAYAVSSNWDFLLPNDGTNFGTIEFTTDMVDNPQSYDSFRYILISSNYILKSARLKSTSMADLKKMPYSEVCKLLNIKE